MNPVPAEALPEAPRVQSVAGASSAFLVGLLTSHRRSIEENWSRERPQGSEVHELLPYVLGALLNKLGDGPQPPASLPDASFEQLLREFNLLRRCLLAGIGWHIAAPAEGLDSLLTALSEVLRDAAAELECRQEVRKTEIGERRFLDLVDNLDHAVAWIADAATGRFVFVARNAAKITGFEIPEWLAPGFLEGRIPHEDFKELEDIVELAKATGESQRCEHRFQDHDGRELWFQTGIRAEPERDGSIRWIRGVCFEITPLKRAMEENRQLLDLSRLDLAMLRKERELRDHLVSTITHDLRNPLAAAKLGVQILGKKIKEHGLALTVDKVVFNISRADRMIRDLLDSQRIRAGEGVPMTLAPFDLAVILREVTDELNLIHGDRFVLRVEGDTKGLWYADGLRRVAENLMVNAVKYGWRGTPITVSLAGESDTVRFSVHNESNAIPEAEQAILFEPFRRISPANSAPQPGWGLGLTVVRGIVHAHKGQVHVSSRSGEGTTFTVVLPRYPSQPMDILNG